MSWLVILILVYIVLAVTTLIDKIFLSKIVIASSAYTVWVSIILTLSVMGLLVVWSFSSGVQNLMTSLGGLGTIDGTMIMITTLVGILFTAALYFLYTALQQGEASRIIPLIGGALPVLVFIISFIFLGERLSIQKNIAFILLLIGAILISIMPKTERKNKKSGFTVILALLASASFALFFVVSQYIFQTIGLINGLVWPRIGTALSLIALVALPSVRHKVVASLTTVTSKLRLYWLLNLSLAASAFVGMMYVLALPDTSVALATALQGIQYTAILIFGMLLAFIRPKLLTEKISTVIIIQKVIALVFIASGLYFIHL